MSANPPPGRPEDRFDAAAQRFQAAAERARAACQALVRPPGAPAVPPRPAARPAAVPFTRPAARPAPGPATGPAAVVIGGPPRTVPGRPTTAAPPVIPGPADPRTASRASVAPATAAPPGTASAVVDSGSVSHSRPPSKATAPAPAPGPGFDLGPYALAPAEDVQRWRVPLTGGRAIEVAARFEGERDGDGHHWSEGFGDMYEALEGVGDTAVWESLSHTLHTQERGWTVTATLDVTFGAELVVSDLGLIQDIARAALAARPEHTPRPASRPPGGRLRRGRRS